MIIYSKLYVLINGSGNRYTQTKGEYFVSVLFEYYKSVEKLSWAASKPILILMDYETWLDNPYNPVKQFVLALSVMAINSVTGCNGGGC